MRLRLASFNLENLDDGGDPPLSARIATLRPQLLRLDADVLCLQEVNGQAGRAGKPRRLSALDRLLAETPYAHFARVATDRGGQGPADKHNLVVLTRLPLLASRELLHDLVPPPDYRPVTGLPAAETSAPLCWDRPILLAEMALPDGRRLQVINLHLRAPLAAPVAGQKAAPFVWRSVAGWAEGFFIAGMKRTGQALEARLLVEQLFDRDPEALIAICGDFNADSYETPLRTMIASGDDTGNSGLAGRGLVPLERSLPASQRFSVLHRGRKVMLDHVLVSRALLGSYQHMEVHNETLRDEAVAFDSGEASAESFHAPLVAQFEIPDA